MRYPQKMGIQSAVPGKNKREGQKTVFETRLLYEIAHKEKRRQQKSIAFLYPHPLETAKEGGRWLFILTEE